MAKKQKPQTTFFCCVYSNVDELFFKTDEIEPKSLSKTIYKSLCNKYEDFTINLVKRKTFYGENEIIMHEKIIKTKRYYE